MVSFTILEPVYLKPDFIWTCCCCCAVLLPAAAPPADNTITHTENYTASDHKSLMNCSIFLIIIYLSVNLDIYFNGQVIWKG